MTWHLHLINTSREWSWKQARWDKFEFSFHSCSRDIIQQIPCDITASSAPHHPYRLTRRAFFFCKVSAEAKLNKRISFPVKGDAFRGGSTPSSEHDPRDIIRRMLTKWQIIGTVWKFHNSFEKQHFAGYVSSAVSHPLVSSTVSRYANGDEEFVPCVEKCVIYHLIKNPILPTFRSTNEGEMSEKRRNRRGGSRDDSRPSM